MLKIPDIHNPRYSYGGGKIFQNYMEFILQKYFKKFINLDLIMFMVKTWEMNIYLNLLKDLKKLVNKKIF